MSVWSEGAEAAVREALSSVQLTNPGGHHFGRPYLSAYQLAIAVNAAHPEIRAALGGIGVGGRGTGARNSLAQYLAGELSRSIRRDRDDYPVQGAFLSNEYVTDLTYRGSDGEAIASSLTGTGFDLSLYRWRQPSEG